MTQKVIQIPTLNDGPHNFVRLFGIWSEANGYKVKGKSANTALHRTAIPLRFIAAGELGR